MERLRTYAAFVKFEHTLFSLPLIYAGALLADGPLTPRLAVLILLAAAGGRTVSLALNRIIDLKFDRQNPRTFTRELPAGRMRLSEAWGVTAAGAILYGWAAWRIAPICLRWSPLPVMLFVCYPFLKRWTALAHLGLGVTWATAPVGGWLAVQQAVVHVAPILWLAAFAALWVAGFDVIYATLDEAWDRALDLRSLPAAMGRVPALRLAQLLHAGALLALAGLSLTALRTWGAFLGWMAVSALLYLEHRQAQRVDLAFFRVNVVVGFTVLALVWVSRSHL